MPIPEDQLDTWAHQGSVTQSKNTYATIKRVLEDENASYAGRSFSVFLQGSYGNDTNVYAESDVDVVICLDESFQYDVGKLNLLTETKFDGDFPNASYGLPAFKKEVTAWLKKIYGAAADAGSKAVYIEGNGTRRDADVLPCSKFRRYSWYNSMDDQSYEEGIAFLRSDGQTISNFPKQHSANLTTKHQNTGMYFKPMVRIFKNLRNRMVDDEDIAAGLAPSYYIEGMLWNVPNHLFGTSYEDTFVAAMNWLLNCEKKKLACANDLFWLLRDDSAVCWNEKDFDAFLAAAAKCWKDW
jgi:hypothetical protein